MVQNMSAFTCPCCSKTTSIFGTEGVRQKALEMGTKFLGDIPIDVGICESGEEGVPIGIKKPGGESARVYEEIAKEIYELI
jgi:ATP-binding protein involved in chromosome partitioning